MRKRLTRILFVLGLLLFIGGISMQLYVKEASYLLQSQTKQRVLSYLYDNNVIDLDNVISVRLDNRVLSFSQPFAKSLNGFYFVIDPTEEELERERKYAKEMEEMGEKYGFIELNRFMIVYELYSDKINNLLLTFPYETYPVDIRIVNSFLQKLALTPAERIKQSSAHRFFDVVFGLIPNSLFYTLATPFRQLAAYFLSISPNTYTILRTPLIAFTGVLISIASFRSVFPPKKRGNNQFEI